MPDKKREATIDEILGRLNKLLAPQLKEKRIHWGCLNSPFVVTVLGSIALALVTSCWQKAQADHDRAQARQDRDYKRKEEVIEEFASEFPYSLALFRDFKQRELWLADYRNGAMPKDSVYPDQRDFIQTRDRYEKTKDKFLKRKPAYAFTADIKAAFRDEETTSLADAITKAMGDAMEAKGPNAQKAVSARVAEIEKHYVSLIASMGSELQGRKKVQ